jgi:hypothetical protein
MFPTLYKETKTGKTHQWVISVEGSTIIRSDGDVGGKQKVSKREISKNTLRTAEQQALDEAEKIWIKQLDKEYKPTDSNGLKIYNYVIEQKSKNGGMNRGVKMFGDTEIKTDTTSGVKDMTIQHHPMLSQKYTDRIDSITFPVFVQGKCDGLRAISYLNGDHVVLESRGGKDFVHLQHIRDALKKVLKPGLVLDGELYVHYLYRNENKPTNVKTNDVYTNVERFQFLSECCKITRKKPHDFEILVEYWVFDIWDNTGKTNKERENQLTKLQFSAPIIKLPTHIANSHEEIEKYFEEYLDKSYEGVMTRNMNATYVSRKGYHAPCLLKYKPFFDLEAEIIGAEKAEGNQQDAVVWKCSLKGKEFSAKQIGTLDMSRFLYEDFCKTPKKYIGRKINIRYNEMTSDEIPRFGRATWFVEDK